MITNERQYKITRAQFERLRMAAESFDAPEALKILKSKLLVKAQLDAIQSQLDSLNFQIQEYETLKSGSVDVLKASSLAELSIILIKARIAKGLSQKDLAVLMGVKEQQIQRYESEEYASANLNRLVEVANALEINIKEIAEFRSFEKPLVINDSELAWERFPIKEMYKRNWFAFTGSLSEAMENAEELVKDFIAGMAYESIGFAAKQHVRIGGSMNKYALFAWQVRVVREAHTKSLHKKFDKSALTNRWFKELAKLSCDSDGPQKAIQYLEGVGIRLVIVPHLSQTHIDGGAFLLSDGPVIAMTLRYDRIDNFWFVLFHELIHVKKHLCKGKMESIFDDLDVNADDIEKEADEEAGEVLVPSQEWETSPARYIRSKDSIEDFAKSIGVSAAIVAGKIRREAGNYIILNDIVGSGAVRRQFSSVDFSC